MDICLGRRLHRLARAAISLATLLVPAVLDGQSLPAAIVGSRLQIFANPPQVAPGELVTFIVRGLDLSSMTVPIVAAVDPLSTELAGVSITIEDARGELKPTAIPILRIDPSGCGEGTWYVCDHAITAQVPFLTTYKARVGQYSIPNHPVFTIWNNGQPGLRSEFVFADTHLNLLNSCEYVAQPATPTCAPVVLHADGSLVDNKLNPVVAGELISIRAIGLGLTTPLVPTGVASPDPPPNAIVPMDAWLSAGSWASIPVDPNPVQVTIELAGLVPGLVGIYQAKDLLGNNISSTR